MQLKYFLFSLFLVCSWAYSQETIIVADHGNTVEIDSYIRKNKIEKKPSFTENEVKKKVAEQFPLTTNLPIGRVTVTKANEKLAANIALVGTDKVSQRFLQKHAIKLRDYGVMVIFIESPSLTTFTRFQTALANAGIMSTRSSSEPFERLVDAYPVLIINNEVYQ